MLSFVFECISGLNFDQQVRNTEALDNEIRPAFNAVDSELAITVADAVVGSDV